MLTYYEMLEKNTKILNTYKVHSIWKFNAFTCFVALIISWGKDFWKSSVRAASSWCLGRQVFGYWYSSLFFRLDLLCKFHWELDCVGMCWVLSLWNLEMWLFWNDMQDWCIAGFSPEYLNYFILLLLLLLLLLLPLLLLFDTSCYYHCLIF